jgi:uncharacterized membrane protein YfcA
VLDPALLLVAAVFALAGFVKGVIGLGLPTITMGLLVLVMPPVEAAAILVVPSLVTNVWQMLAGPHLGALLRRLWPMLLGSCLGTWAGASLMTGAHARYGVVVLGAALALYAVSGLASWTPSLRASSARWLGPLAGALTGVITAATGVFVIPAVPYLAALRLERDALVQALGLSFTVSTLALALNLAGLGALDGSVAAPAAVALLAAAAGMVTGQVLRQRMRPALFRRCFFGGLLLLGLYLMARSGLS